MKYRVIHTNFLKLQCLIKLILLNYCRTNSLLRLTSLIYAEKFEFENPAITEDKQSKQTQRFSVMTKGRYYFLS